MKLFDILDAITQTKEDLNFNDDEIKKNYSNFIINRFVSMSEAFIPLVNEINKYGDIPKSVHYRYLSSSMPKRKQYFKYLKKQKDINEDELPYIADYFSVSIREAKQYMTMLKKETINEILDTYVCGRGKGKRIILE